MSKILVIVAKYKERDDWIVSLKSMFQDSVTVHVYDKGNGDYKNVGREAETYLRAILDHWDDLECARYKRVVFLQGNPFDHTTKDRLYETIQSPEAAIISLGHELTCDSFGKPHHTPTKLAVATSWDMLLKTPHDPTWTFCVGAQYNVAVSILTAHPKSFWEHFHDCVYTGKICPWTCERLWKELFEFL